MKVFKLSTLKNKEKKKKEKNFSLLEIGLIARTKFSNLDYI